MTTHEVGSYRFEWTKLHLLPSTTDILRHEYDTLGSHAVNKLQELSKSKSEGHSQNGGQDLFAMLRETFHQDQCLSKLWEEVHSVPDWVDWEQLERGQKFFYRYALANIMGFALQGFVGENSAASGVVEVLVRTGGFSTRALPRRLLETFQFILQVTKSIHDIRPGGKGHEAAVRVRLLHSAVRERILKLTKRQPQYYDTTKHGIPINHLDSIHSLSVFCCNHMWLHLPLMGIRPRRQEIADYIALWRYVGYLLGTPTEHFSTLDGAKAVMESMLLHERNLTETSRVVGYNFLQSVKDWPPFNLSVSFIEAGGRVMNGQEFCDDLGFGRPGFLSYACFTGHCWLVRCLAIAQQLSPKLDNITIRYCRRILHQSVIESPFGLGGASRFRFLHVPSMKKRTVREATKREHSRSYFVTRPLEAAYFSIFLLGSTVILGGSFFAVYFVLSCGLYLTKTYVSIVGKGLHA